MNDISNTPTTAPLIPILIAPRQISDSLGNVNSSQMLSFGRQNPDAARSRAPDVSQTVDLDSIRAANPFHAGRIEEDLAIGNGTIRLHAIAQPR